MTQFLKISFLSFLFLISIQSKGQDKPNLNLNYQYLLDVSTFVEKVNSYPELFCGESLRTNQDFPLSFQGKELILDSRLDCATVKFSNYQIAKNKYLISCVIFYEELTPEGLKIIWVSSTATVKVQGNTSIFTNTRSKSKVTVLKL